MKECERGEERRGQKDKETVRAVGMRMDDGSGGWVGGGAEGRSRETLREKRGTEEPPSGTSCSGFVLMCSALRSRFLNFVLSSTHMKGPIRS